MALIGALVLVGGIVFDRAVAGPAIGRVRDHAAGRTLRERRNRWTRRLALAGIGLWGAGTLLQLPVQVSVATGEPVYRPSWQAVQSLISETTWGQAWLARLVLLVVASALLALWMRRREGSTA